MVDLSPLATTIEPVGQPLAPVAEEISPLDRVTAAIEAEAARRSQALESAELTFEGPSFRTDEEISVLGETFRAEADPIEKETLRRQFLGSAVVEGTLRGRATFGKTRRTPTTRERAIFFGIDREEGAGAGARLAQGFGDEIQGPQGALGENFDVFFDEELQDVVFVDKTTGEKKLVNEPGLDPGDFGSFAPDLITIGAEIAGFVPGVIAKKPQLAIVGAAGGAFVGEQARLRTGRSLGFNNFTDSEINQRASWVGAISLIAGEAGLGVNKVTQILRSKGAGPFKNQVDANAVEEGIRKAKVRVENIEEVTGETVTPRTGQVLKEVDPQTAANLEATETALIEGTPTGQPLRASRQEQARIAGEVREEVIPKTQPLTVQQQTELGKVIQQEIAQAPSESIARAEARVAQAELDAQAAFDNLGVSPSVLEANQTVRGVLVEGRQAVRDGFKKRFTELEGAESLTVDIAKPQKLAKSKLDAMDNLFFKGSTAEDSAAFRADLAELAEFKGGAVTLGDVQGTLMNLRAAKRAILNTPGVPKRVVNDMADMEKALLKARSEAIEGNPVLAEQIANLERDFAIASEEIERGAIGKIVDKTSSTRFRVEDQKVLTELLKAPEEAARVAAALKDPKFATEFAGANESIRKGIFAKYEADVIRDGVVNVAAHKRFVGKFGASIKPFLSEREFKLINSAGTSQKFLEATVKQEQALIRQLNKDNRFALNLTEYDPLKVVDKVWKEGDLAMTQRVMELLSKHPEKLADFKRIYSQRVRQSIISPGVAGETVNLRGLNKILESPERLEAMELALGEDYVQGLTAVRDLAVLTSPQAGGRAVTEAVTRFYTGTGSDIARGAGATPLTTAGRLLTANLRFTRKATQRAMVKLLEDPERMARFVRIRNQPNAVKALIGLFFEIGALEHAQELQSLEEILEE